MSFFKKMNPKDQQPNGYQETIERGLRAVRYFGQSCSYGKGNRTEQIERLRKEIETADAIVIGADS